MSFDIDRILKKLRKKLPFVKGTADRYDYDALERRGFELAPDVLRVEGKQTIHFERPCRLNDSQMQLAASFHLGAYSYLSGGIVKGVESIGRYASIEQHVVIGENELPMAWTSTSPAFFSSQHFRFHDKREPETFLIRTENNDPHLVASKTVIGNDVLIGAHVFIRRGVTIGDGAIVQAGSIVLADVDPYTVVSGTPAKPVGMRFPDEGLITALLDFRWWEFDIPKIAGLPVTDPAKLIEDLAKRERAGEVTRREKKLRRIVLLHDRFRIPNKRKFARQPSDGVPAPESQSVAQPQN